MTSEATSIGGLFHFGWWRHYQFKFVLALKIAPRSSFRGRIYCGLLVAGSRRKSNFHKAAANL